MTFYSDMLIVFVVKAPCDAATLRLTLICSKHVGGAILQLVLIRRSQSQL